MATESGTSQTSPTRTWVGTVLRPRPRSAEDCENAAAALVQNASLPSAGLAGTYGGWDFMTLGDVWPGDLLALNSNTAALSTSVIVRKVQVQLGPTLKYVISFSNPWAEELAIHLSSTVPDDVILPQEAQEVTPLADLTSLSVSGISISALQINTGASAPAGGGFEVRRVDWGFGSGASSDLVLQSPVPNISIPRSAPSERFYVRMYDGGSPPNYSRHSAAVFTNNPTS